MEPGAAGATQAGRHTQTTGYMWPRTEGSRRCGCVGRGARTKRLKRRDTGERRACRTGPQTSYGSYKFSHHPPTLQCENVRQYRCGNPQVRIAAALFSRARSHVRGSAGFNPSNFNQRAGSTPGTGRRIRWENPLRSVVRRGGEGQSPAPLLRMHDNLSTSFVKRTGQRSAIRRVEGQPEALK